MSKTENQRRILTKCSFLAHSEKFPRDLAKVQKDLWCWLMYGTKYMLPLQGFFQLVQRFKRYEPKTWSLRLPHGSSGNLFYEKSRKTCKLWWDIGEKWRKMAEVGLNWLKPKYEPNSVDKLVWCVGVHLIRSLGGSVVPFCIHVQRSGVQTPLQPGFFLFSYMGQMVMGSNPPWICTIFSFVESNNLYHLWVFGLITDLYQAEKVLGNFVYIKTEFWTMWNIF